MATHDGGAGQPSDRDPNLPEQDTDIPSNHLEDIDNFENVEHENHTTLKALTRNLDDLWHRVENAEGQPMEAIHHLKCEIHRLSLTLQPPAPPEPLNEVLQQYMETLCFAQIQTTFANTSIQDIPIFSGSDFAQLEDWLTDIETAADLTDESRTKVAQAKSKGLTHTLITEAITLDKIGKKLRIHSI